VAYLHKDSFEIVRDGERDLLSAEYIYADDMIAQTVQVLNARGYSTPDFGTDRPFETISQTTLFNVRDSQGREPRLQDIAKAYRERFPEVKVVSIRRTGNRTYKLIRSTAEKRRTFIRFTQGTYLPCLPSNSDYTDGVLSHYYPAEAEGMDFLQLCLEYCRNLYEWASSLPLNI